jgi:hypothetical protein
MTQSLTLHPLAETLARVGQLNEYLKVSYGLPDGSGWLVPPTDFVAGTARLAALVAATQARLQTKAPNIVGSSLLQSYQWPIISAAVACYLVDRRVPDLDATQLRLHYIADGEQAGEADAIAFASGRFWVLPDDPDAAHADAIVVPNQQALRDALRDALIAHLGQTIDQLCAELGCKARGLWLNVADSCASNLVWLMQEHNKTVGSAQIAAEVDALVRTADSPLRTKQIGVFQLSYREHTAVYLDRATCCYWYKTKDGDYCTTCPKRSTEDRNARLLTYLAEEYEERLKAAATHG